MISEGRKTGPQLEDNIKCRALIITFLCVKHEPAALVVCLHNTVH